MAPIGGVRAGYLSDGKDAIPDSGVSRYLFEQDYNDEWGTNDGTANGDPQFVTDSKEGSYAVDLDGTGDYVSLGSDSSLNLTDEFSWVGWAKPSTLSNFDRMVSKRDSSNSTGPELLIDAGPNLEFLNGDASVDLIGSTTLPTGSYWHFAVTYSASNGRVRLYYEGSQDGSVTGISSLSDHSGVNMLIGERPAADGFEFDGLFDLVDVYDKELTSTEISNHRDTGSING